MYIANRESMLRTRLELKNLGENRLVTALCKLWPFTRKYVRIGNTLEEFGKLFHVAAIVKALDACDVQHTKIAQQVVNFLKVCF